MVKSLFILFDEKDGKFMWLLIFCDDFNVVIEVFNCWNCDVE